MLNGYIFIGVLKYNHKFSFLEENAKLNMNFCLFFIFSPTDVTVLKQPCIVQELTSVLKEWGVIWKVLYIVSNAINVIIDISLSNKMEASF